MSTPTLEEIKAVREAFCKRAMEAEKSNLVTVWPWLRGTLDLSVPIEDPHAHLLDLTAGKWDAETLHAAAAWLRDLANDAERRAEDME